ncbi:hypothetical protein AGLY_014198 [Aphis glycines]|uniref:Uncharacterized protein n=1 Tax=Aphis glycines TaxID=307491 RepID=A0A6G0T4D3_APHGL|nr:hypothetical protein AGLY_014198 [Aphis glycines]
MEEYFSTLNSLSSVNFNSFASITISSSYLLAHELATSQTLFSIITGSGGSSSSSAPSSNVNVMVVYLVSYDITLIGIYFNCSYNSERSDECIDSTMIIKSRNNASISYFGGGFRWQSEYPWCIIITQKYLLLYLPPIGCRIEFLTQYYTNSVLRKRVILITINDHETRVMNLFTQGRSKLPVSNPSVRNFKSRNPKSYKMQITCVTEIKSSSMNISIYGQILESIDFVLLTGLSFSYWSVGYLDIIWRLSFIPLQTENSGNKKYFMSFLLQNNL